MAERTLTETELNRALLARQLLLERADVPIARALERVGGLQTQYAPSGYIGLWSRLRGFGRDDLTRALERRSVIQATLMRSTIHLVSARDYPLMAEGVRAARRERWIRGHRGHAEPAQAEAAAGRLRSILAGRVMSRSELMQQLEAQSPVWNGAGLWIDLVRAPPSGTWEHRRADLYALADDWLGPANVAPDVCREHLVRRYLAGFGPAPVADIASWAGLAPRAVASVVERMPLRRFRDEAGGVLLDLPRAPLPDAGTPAPVRFLPVWEAALLVHGRRTQILPERYRPLAFNTKTPHSVNTFLVDGRVAGTWRHVGRAVKVEPFEPLPPGVIRELEDEGRRLAEFLA